MDCTKITDAEWLVMKVLWKEAPLTASKIIKELKNDIEWSPTTVQTLVSRLVKKRALGVNKESSAYKYFPLISEEECMRVETNSFLDKVYNGSFLSLVENFIRYIKSIRKK
jgi:BlaI family penicillinase repressor